MGEGVIERHYGALLDGARDAIAARLAAVEALQAEALRSEHAL